MKRTLLQTMAALSGAATIFAAPFTPGNVVVYRIGDGVAALTNASTAVFLDEYTPAGAFVQSVAMPTAAAGSNKILTGSGTATSEGLLTLSGNGQFLMLAGYNVAPGTASVANTTSAATNRVVGRVDGSGNIDTTTALTDAFSGTAGTAGNPRCAVSTDGTNIWLSGGGSPVASTGSRFTTLGSTTSTQLSTTQTNLRASNIFGGQLYVSSGVAALRLGFVGVGTPTTSGQTITSLPGFPTATGGNPLSPYQFFFADLDGTAGVDTVYVADDDSTASGGGVQKYSLVGGTWTASGIVALANARGLTGVVNGTNVTLYVTAANSSSTSSSLQTLTDTSGYNAMINGTLASLATSGTNTVFRGVAFAPSSGGAVPVLTSAASRLTHGGAGDFDVPLPLTGTAGVECRLSSTYNIVLAFTNGPITSGTAMVTAGTGTAGAPIFSGNTMTVPLTGVTNAQTLTLTVNNVNGQLPSASVSIGFLVGDTGGNGSVNAADIGQTKSQSGQSVSNSNFREDVTADGVLNAADIGLVKSRSGTALP